MEHFHAPGDSLPLEDSETSSLRLSALADYKILDTPPEPEFDDLVQLARTVCNTPVALVSLVEINRQWFKARVGFSLCETAISESVCAHAIKEDDILVIPDLSSDPRTASNGLVMGDPFIRFYAGAVLKTPGGVALGTLCVIDTSPRPDGLTPEQTDALRALARQTMVIMAMRRAVDERVDALVKEREARLLSVERARVIQAASDRVRLDEARARLAQQAGGIGTFDVEVASDRCFVSAEFCRIFGLKVQDEYAMPDLQLLIHEDDRGSASTLQNRMDGTASLEIEFRIRRDTDGAVRWIGRRSVFHADQDGIVRRMVGVVQDITERKLGEARRSALIAFNDDLGTASTMPEVIRLSSRTLGETLGVARTGFCLFDKTSGIMTVDDDWTAPGAKSIAGRYAKEAFAKTVTRLETGGPVIVANLPGAPWLADDNPWFESIGTKAMITVPVIDRGVLIGLAYAHNAEPRTWSAAEVEFVQTVADRGFAVVAKIQAEQQQHLLNEELSHRLKNTLAMVQAIAGQTLRAAGDRLAVRAFEDRIIALSRAHDVLLQQNWAAARIETVVTSVLSLHGRTDHVEVSGPNLTLGPKATLSVSLLLHELATNALKYGALSCDEGRITLAWHVEQQEREPILVMSWTERGGPPAVEPTRRGFGSRLISMGLVGTGRVQLDFAQSGLQAVFAAPLAKIAEH